MTSSRNHGFQTLPYEYFRLRRNKEKLEPCLQGMGAPQAGRRDTQEAITMLFHGSPTITTMIHYLLSLGCHARVSWISMGCWVGTRTGYFFNFLPWDGTSTHTILGPETE